MCFIGYRTTFWFMRACRLENKIVIYTVFILASAKFKPFLF